MPDPTDQLFPLTVARIIILPYSQGGGIVPILTSQSIWASAPEAYDWIIRRLINDPLSGRFNRRSTMAGELLNGRQVVRLDNDDEGKPVMRHELHVDFTSRVPVEMTPELLAAREAAMNERRLKYALAQQAAARLAALTGQADSVSLEQAYPIMVAA